MTTYTACCFGGPLDRQWRSHDTREFNIALMAPVKSWLAESELTPPTVNYRTRQYVYKVLALPTLFGAEFTGAWLYVDGWIEDEKVEDHIVMGLKVMWWLARAWNGR